MREGVGVFYQHVCLAPLLTAAAATVKYVIVSITITSVCDRAISLVSCPTSKIT